MKWGEKAHYLDGTSMSKGRARYADVLLLVNIILWTALIAWRIQ